MEIEETYPNIIKSTYDKPIATTTPNWQKLKAFPLRLGTRQGCLLSVLIQHSTGSLSHSNQTRRNKGIQIGTEEGKLIIHK